MAEPITIDRAQPAPDPELPDFDGWTCPVPLRNSPTIQMGHGGGGAMSAELVEHLFGPAFANPILAGLGDSAVVELVGHGLPSRPTPTSYGRCSSPAAASVNSPSTAP